MSATTLRPVDDCGCCEGIERVSPLEVGNEPGLNAIAYRIGRHAQFAETLASQLAAQPTLQALKTREPDDFTNALADAFASMADVITFYQERIANESYVATATERRSLEEMARLVGYRLKPGVAAETYLAFSVDDSAPAAAAFKYATGLRVQSIPGPGEKPQTFETVEPIEAHGAWNDMPASTTVAWYPRRGSTQAYLAGTSTNLKAGDAVLFIGRERMLDPESDQWALCTLAVVQSQPEANRTHIVWRTPLGSAWPVKWGPSTSPPVHALAMRERAAVFGHTAQDWQALTLDYRRTYLKDKNLKLEELPDEWPRFTIHGPKLGKNAPDMEIVMAMNDAADLLRETVRQQVEVAARQVVTKSVALAGMGGQFAQQTAEGSIDTVKDFIEAAKLGPAAVMEILQPIVDLVTTFTDGAGAQITGLGAQMTATQNAIGQGLQDIGQALGGLVPPHP